MSKVKQHKLLNFTSRHVAQVSVAALFSLGSVIHAAQADDRSVAAPTPGFYVGAGVGANLEEDNRFRGGGANATAS
jgi:hypothetical protein